MTATRTAPTAGVVPAVLARYRERTLTALLHGLPDGGPPYLYELLPAYPARGGKGLRAALLLATCAAFGGDVDRALNSAVAVELFHNAFLIHDDIQDGSEQRRGAATLGRSHGPAIALNVGNAMNLVAMQRIRANRAVLGAGPAWTVFEQTDEMLRHSLEGQAIELGWIRDNVDGLTDDDYLRMCLKKTSWYTCLYPCRVGLIVARADGVDPLALDRYGWYLGAAFQIQDDLLNLTGRFDSYGKEILSDLREGKRTLMLIALQRALRGRDATRLRTFLATPRAARAESDVRWVFDMMRAGGTLDTARATAHRLAGAALAEAERVLHGALDGADREFLLALPRYVVERTS